MLCTVSHRQALGRAGAMDHLLMLLFLATGRHPGSAQQSWTDVPAVRRGIDVIWHDPGAVQNLDFRYGVGGRELEPQPPFTFLREDRSGTTAKVFVRDAKGREWQVRFGPKAGPDTFSSRIAWAVGYYVEPNYYFGEGVIEGAHDLHRTRRYIRPNGQFTEARFQLRSKQPEFLTGIGWSWDRNPFVGAHQLEGLKIMMMLVSGYDNKDLHQAKTLGSNTGIYRAGDEYEFFVDDWGRSLGRWGGLLHRSTANAEDFFRQTPKFITGVNGGEVQFAFKGHNTEVMRRGVKVSDVRWLMQYLGRVTDRQIHTGLLNCGATPEEANLFATALRARIRELELAAQGRPLERRAAVAAR
jgi:hypothetical protein